MARRWLPVGKPSAVGTEFLESVFFRIGDVFYKEQSCDRAICESGCRATWLLGGDAFARGGRAERVDPVDVEIWG